MSHHIKQSVQLQCSAKTAFDAWLDPKVHGEMIDGKAHIEAYEGGTFDIWDGAIIGKTTHLDDDSLTVVQNWRYEYKSWPTDKPSIITLRFESTGPKSCTLHFHQHNVPPQYFDDVADGWQRYYWKPMQEYFEKASQS